MSSFSRLLGVAIFFAGTTALAAEPTPADVEAAKNNFIEATEQREKGNLERALAFFRSAYTLVPTPITGLEVGRTELALGHMLQARETLKAAAAMPPKPGESAKAKESRAEAERLAAEITHKLARVKLAAEPTAPPPDEVAIDGKTVDVEQTHELDPGRHVVTVRRGQTVARHEVDLKEGEERAVPIQPPEPPKPAERRFHASPLLWAGAVTAGAGLVAGGVFGIAAFATAGSVKSACPNKVCPPSKEGDVQLSSAMGWVSTVGFIVAGVGAAIAVVGLATSWSRVEPARTGIYVLPDGIGGRF